MWARYQIRRARRIARHVSKFSRFNIDAKWNGIVVGTFKKGKEVK